MYFCVFLCIFLCIFCVYFVYIIVYIFVYILCSDLDLHILVKHGGTVDACKKVNNEDKTWWRGLVRRSNKLIVSD